MPYEFSMGLKFRILIVDDSPADVHALQECLSRTEWNCEVDVARDGFALSQILERAESDDSLVPDLVFMDVHLPKAMNGLDIARVLRRNAKWKYIPFIALSGSNAERDVKDAYDGGMSAYLMKGVELDELEERIRRTLYFWLGAARLPTHAKALETAP